MEEELKFSLESSDLTLDLDVSHIDKASYQEFSENHPDLFGYQAIQVTAGVNKNDTYFDPIELWKAKFNSNHKKVDVEHEDVSGVVGHIVDCYPVDENMKPLDIHDDSNAILTKHLVTYAVIYKIWQDKKKQEKVWKIIGEIPDGKWKVSMECLHLRYDYLLLKQNSSLTAEEQIASGIARVIERTPDNQKYMDSFLRKNKGAGVYEGDRIYMYSKDIIFIGQGLVEKPANPESIILDYDKTVKLSSTKIGEAVMTVENQNTAAEVVADKATEVASTDTATATVDKSAEELASLKASWFTEKEKADKASADLDAARTELDAAKAELASFKEKCSAMEADVAAKENFWEKFKKEKAEWEAEKASVEKANKLSARMNLLKSNLNMNEDEAKEMCDMDMEEASFQKIVAAMMKFKGKEKATASTSVTDQASAMLEAAVDTANAKSQPAANSNEHVPTREQKILGIFQELLETK